MSSIFLYYLFRAEDAGIACGDTEVSLTVGAEDGISFMGADVIETVGCDTFSCHP